ncbi:MAG: MarC family protein [Pseudomonadota bacterium]|nr:MarC family protein [Pseudomonadota bacterium]
MSAIDWLAAVQAAATLFFIMDPLGNIPVFNSLLKEYPAPQRARIIAREMGFALFILLFFLFAGTRILEFLGLSRSSLSLSGGILLFIIAIRMIFPTPRQQREEPVEAPFIVPLAVPMIAGPSTISVLLLLSSTAPERMADWTTALLMAWGAGTLILVFSPAMLRLLGERGLRAIERLMGMLLILIAVQMIMDGVTEYVGGLGLGG